MRIARLDLLRYGRFTDQALELPLGQPDMHIVFGRNEAGKSTALSALEDLLFGIPGQTPLNFLHDYSKLRIGATLERDGERLVVRRRKGNRDTLLDASDRPLASGQDTLVPSGADRGFFERMFSLDHERLRRGGQEILEANDDVGRLLFSAGAGVEGLPDTLRALDKEADQLWGKKRAARRDYYQAEDRLQEAKRALKEHIVTVADWQKSKRAFEDAGQQYQALHQQAQDKDAEQRRLSRIRRVHRDVAKRFELQAEIKALAGTVAMPEDALDTLERALRKDDDTEARKEALAEQLEAECSERDRLRFDMALVEREGDIANLGERRAQVLASKRDLPKRQQELVIARAELLRLATDIDWSTADPEQLTERIPTPPVVARVRATLNRRGERRGAVDAARAALEDAQARIAGIEQQLPKAEKPVDIAPLAASIRATRAHDDIALRIDQARNEAAEAGIWIEQMFASLKPAVDEESALTPPPPPRDAVQAHRDRRRELNQRREECQRTIREAKQSRDRLEAQLRRVEDEGYAVSQEQLDAVRQRRDQQWSKFRSRYINGDAQEETSALAGDGRHPADTYEQTVKDADHLADRRFDNAEAAAQLAQIKAQLAEQDDLLKTLRDEEQAQEAENGSLADEWRTLWRDTPVEPASPDEMLEWIAAREELRERLARRQQAEQRAAGLRQQEGEMATQLATKLQGFIDDTDALRRQPLHTVLERAADVQEQQQRLAAQHSALREQLRQAKEDSTRRQQDLRQAEQDWAAWESEWADALAAASLDAATYVDEVNERLGIIDKIRNVVDDIHNLQHERIEPMEQDIRSFEAETADMVQAVAADLGDVDAEDAAFFLGRRLDEAKQIRETRGQKDESIAALEHRIGELDESRQDAQQAIRLLQEQAKTNIQDELRTAIERSERLRMRQAELVEVTARLEAEGDGHSLEELQEECAGVELDEIAAQEQAGEDELNQLHDARQEAYQQLAQARQAFEAIGGHDAAALAGADRQAAFAELRDVAERYARLRCAALLLEWGIDRYRQTKQAPLLQRAGDVFAALTGGSFAGLSLDFDTQDRPVLAGRRPNGAQVGVGGLSTGSADQLYLALRLAAIEDYLDRTSPLPFVADDMFVHFDDERSAAGFEVLGQLAERCQVIFFTHHEHLIEVAKQSLPGPLSIIELP